MRPRLLNNRKIYNPGDKSLLAVEEPIVDLGFHVHKYTSRKFPDEKRDRLYISCFSEFGCEVIGSLYCVPRLAQKFPGKYRIAMGWHGREYLYRHLVDEFWELKEEHMWLREYCRAFNHTSLNLARLEEGIDRKQGIMVDSRYMALQVAASLCNGCHKMWADSKGTDKCPYCGANDLRRSLFGNIAEAKKTVCLPRTPVDSKMKYAASLLGPRPVGVFARGRKCYGRNLPPEFYVRLIELLESRGYTPIWLGEPSTTQPCPVDRVLDFSRMPESRDMETTVAIIKQCEFTVQFWTASTRLAAIVGTPYLLVESPEQLWDGSDYKNPGQEGYRLELSTFGPRKVAACTFDNFLHDQDAGLKIVERCVTALECGDYSPIVGLVEDESAARRLLKDFNERCRLEF